MYIQDGNNKTVSEINVSEINFFYVCQGFFNVGGGGKEF